MDPSRVHAQGAPTTTTSAPTTSTTEYAAAATAGSWDIPPRGMDVAAYEEMQRLAGEYVPDVKGPLIGVLKDSKVLEEEYAGGDPAFVRKTRALSPKYSSYRTVRGDGNCGWRALAFGFFELLQKTNDPNRYGMEHARIKSLSGLMENAGLPTLVYEDFAGMTFEILSKLSTLTPDMLLEKFCNPEYSDAIVMHFKFLTSAWLKSNIARYSPFVGGDVQEYCASQIEPYGIEIDHAGLMALSECIIQPAGFAVEVIYLDRSEGDEVNIHRFDNSGDGLVLPADAPVLRLLYRPGHYDILYKHIPLPPAVYPSNIQVSFLQSPPDALFAATPAAYGLGPHDLGLFDSMMANPLPGNFRPSQLSIPEFQPSPFKPLPFQTTTFRNSPFNPSHFQSENFQPEIYQPPTPTTPGKKGHS